MGIADTVDADLTGGGMNGTGDGFDKGGFTRTVLAHQCVYFTFLKGDGHVIKGRHAGVYFCNVFQFQFRKERLLSACLKRFPANKA